MDTFLAAVADVAEDAARAIMAVCAAGFVVQTKSDKSPVTEADHAAHRVIAMRLAALTPEVALISEENEVQPERSARWWCVDPLDGTRSFARGYGEFTVNIALMESDVPVLGVIACPLDGSCYAGAVGKGAWRRRAGGEWERIAVSGRTSLRGGDAEAAIQPSLPWASTAGLPRFARNDDLGVTAIIGSREVSKRMKLLLEAWGVGDLLAMTSARKFCVVAEGSADVYPRFAPTYEWDTAAGQALLEAAGGHMVTIDNAPFVYGKPKFENGGFIAWGSMKQV